MVSNWLGLSKSQHVNSLASFVGVSWGQPFLEASEFFPRELPSHLPWGDNSFSILMCWARIGFIQKICDHLMWNSQGCVCKKGTKHPRDKQRNGFYQRYHFWQFEPQTSWVNQFWKRLHLSRKGVWMLFEVKRKMLYRARSLAASSSQGICSAGKDSWVFQTCPWHRQHHMFSACRIFWIGGLIVKALNGR